MIILQALMNSLSSIPYGVQFFYAAITLNSVKDRHRLAEEHLFLQITRLSYYINFISSFYIYIISSEQIRLIIRNRFCQQNDNSIPENILLTDIAKNSSDTTQRKFSKVKLSAISDEK